MGEVIAKRLVELAKEIKDSEMEEDYKHELKVRSGGFATDFKEVEGRRLRSGRTIDV
jgi:hypothetical protein